MIKALQRLGSLLNIKPRGVPKSIPPFLLLSAQFRGGLSPNRVSSRVFQREKEIYSADEPHRVMYSIIIEEVMKDIQENGVIEVAIPPGTPLVVAAGGNAGGPIVVNGTTTNFLGGKGVLR